MEKSKNFLYKTCETLPIENFYAILNTNNFAWLHKDYEDGDEYTDVNTNGLKSIWLDIHDEYTDLLNKNSGTKDFTIVANLVEMENEMSIVSSLIYIYDSRNSDAIKEQIELWGYYPDDLDKSLKKLKTIQFKISIIKSKNPDLFNKPDENDDKVEYDLYSDVVLLEESLGDGRTIDVKTTVVSKWVKYIQVIEKKNKKHG